MLDPSEKAIWRVEEDSKLKEVKAYTKANSKEILKLGKVQWPLKLEFILAHS